MNNPLSTLPSGNALSYPLPGRPALSLLVFLVVSMLAITTATASVITNGDATSTQTADAGISPGELQAILTAEEVPVTFWVAVGDNEFAILEPDSHEIIAYVALYESQRPAVSEVNRILTSSSAQLTFSPVTGLSGSSTSNTASGNDGDAGSQSAAISSHGSGNGSGNAAGRHSANGGGSATTSVSSAKSADVASNSDFAPLLTENPIEFDDPAAATDQFSRISALADTPELSPALLLTADSDSMFRDGGAGSSVRSSVVVPSPNSLWLLLFTPFITPIRRKKTTLVGT